MHSIRTLSLSGLLVVVACNFAALASTTKTGDRQNSDQRFQDICERNFDSWDYESKGMLTPDEIDNLIQDPNIKGETAAAVSALKLYFRKNKDIEGLTQYQLCPGESDSIDKSLSENFFKLCGKIAKASPQLFNNGVPHIEEIVQGKTGDCYFLATVGGMAYHQPNRVIDMIQPNLDGTYDVKFPRHNAIRVPAPTDCEVACYSDAGDDGLWLHVLEKAYAVFKSRKSSDPDTEALDMIIHGGSGGRMIMFLTGKVCHRYPSAKTDGNVMRERLQDALAKNHVVNTGTSGHCLTVLAYDPATDVITIWNPWGTSSFYKTAGQEMKHGVFSLQFDDFKSRFISLLIESDKPVTGAKDYIQFSKE